jgi:hypothetical protein
MAGIQSIDDDDDDAKESLNFQNRAKGSLYILATVT